MILNLMVNNFRQHVNQTPEINQDKKISLRDSTISCVALPKIIFSNPTVVTHYETRFQKLS